MWNTLPIEQCVRGRGRRGWGGLSIRSQQTQQFFYKSFQFTGSFYLLVCFPWRFYSIDIFDEFELFDKSLVIKPVISPSLPSVLSRKLLPARSDCWLTCWPTRNSLATKTHQIAGCTTMASAQHRVTKVVADHGSEFSGFINQGQRTMEMAIKIYLAFR